MRRTPFAHSLIWPALLLALLAQSAVVLCLRWGTPLSSPHAFRETETAISVYYMLHGGHFLPYWTPVLGPPWSIMFEFPTYQWVVAGVTYATGCSLDNVGRVVGYLFWLGCLWPLRALSRRHDMDGGVMAALLLGSPVYLYWGTCFLIETCSLFLCLMFLMYSEEERWGLTTLFAVLAAVTKLPTFVPFAMLSILLMKRGRPIPVAAIVILATTCGVIWNHWTDTLKAANPLSAVLMSNQPRQKLHNFGTLSQRLEVPATLLESLRGLI